MDTRTPEQRRRIMKSVGTKNTSPEMLLRRLLHRIGYRYRLHGSKLPGRPDLVFPSRKKVIFVHGCYWHGHGCSKGKLPKSRLEYWAPKIAGNKRRDAAKQAALNELGWTWMIVWACELKAVSHLTRELSMFLGRPNRNRSTSATKRASVAPANRDA
jgi:DNA mismatch endonuclease, patch repair protein